MDSCVSKASQTTVNILSINMLLFSMLYTHSISICLEQNSNQQAEIGGFYHPLFVRFIVRDSKHKNQSSATSLFAEPHQHTTPTSARHMLDSTFVSDEMLGRSNWAMDKRRQPNLLGDRISHSDETDTKMPALSSLSASSKHSSFAIHGDSDATEDMKPKRDDLSDLIHLLGDNIVDASMTNWLLGGAVSLPDLGQVLRSYQSEADIGQGPIAPPTMGDGFSSVAGHTKYDEEIIALFGGSECRDSPSDMIM
jgi:hypothetical protein